MLCYVMLCYVVYDLYMYVYDLYMYVYVCICMYMYVYVCICMYMYVYVCDICPCCIHHHRIMRVYTDTFDSRK